MASPYLNAGVVEHTCHPSSPMVRREAELGETPETCRSASLVHIRANDRKEMSQARHKERTTTEGCSKKSKTTGAENYSEDKFRTENMAGDKVANVVVS